MSLHQCLSNHLPSLPWISAGYKEQEQENIHREIECRKARAEARIKA
jgi:hypothetical protein